MRIWASILTCLCSIHLVAQTTINTKEKTNTTAAHKILLIPFEPRMYLSEIDHHINQETKLSARQIKNSFRNGINEQLYKAFKNNKYAVVDLVEDTVKYKKDLESIYQYLQYEYLKVPDQANYKAPVREKQEKKIEKGQLNVETDVENRFMNAKVSQGKVLTSLGSKYRCDLFLFVNQLEIKAAGAKNPGELVNPNGNRKIILHYTVYNNELKEINSGIAETEFAFNLNTPKKIIDKHFSAIAREISERVKKALLPKASTTSSAQDH
ncbi:MAG: hypothetical protein IPM51_04835 [Sphingobacteriaceae bacterium]|nr:hypothetical protein [Sphingobacteriaceae bacterium]